MNSSNSNTKVALSELSYGTFTETGEDERRSMGPGSRGAMWKKTNDSVFSEL